MKKYFLVFVILFSSTLLSPVNRAYGSEVVRFPVDEKSGEIRYTAIVVLDSTRDKQDLFNNAKEWATNSFVNLNCILQMQDKEDGILVIKANFNTGENCVALGGPPDRVEFTLTIYVKDGRYKYDIKDIHYKSGSDPKWDDKALNQDRPKFFMGSRWEAVQMKTSSAMLYLIKSLEQNMRSKKGKEDSSW